MGIIAIVSDSHQAENLGRPVCVCLMSIPLIPPATLFMLLTNSLYSTDSFFFIRPVGDFGAHQLLLPPWAFCFLFLPFSLLIRSGHPRWTENIYLPLHSSIQSITTKYLAHAGILLSSEDRMDQGRPAELTAKYWWGGGQVTGVGRLGRQQLEPLPQLLVGRSQQRSEGWMELEKGVERGQECHRQQEQPQGKASRPAWGPTGSSARTMEGVGVVGQGEGDEEASEKIMTGVQFILQHTEHEKCHTVYFPKFK